MVDAEKEHDRIVSRYVIATPVFIGQKAPSPERVLDAAGYTEIQQAEKKMQNAQKEFRRELDLYYKTK